MTLKELLLPRLANPRRYKLTNPEPIPTTTSFISLSHSRPLSIYPNHLKATHQTGPVTQSLMKLFRVTNPKPSHSSLPIPSCGNYNEGFPQHSFSLLESLVVAVSCLLGPQLVWRLSWAGCSWWQTSCGSGLSWKLQWAIYELSSMAVLVGGR